MVSNMAFATLDEKTLYIQGGFINQQLKSNQLFALDLTQQSWSATSPPWKPLNLGAGPQSAPSTSDHTMAVSKDKQRLIVSNPSGAMSTYNITSDSWLDPRILEQSPASTGIHQAAMDPTTGYVYIPSGSDNGASMMVYNPTDGTASTASMPPAAGQQGLSFFGAAWSTVRQSIILYGGLDSTGMNSHLLEFQPVNSRWVNLNAVGPSPGDVSAPCVVPAYNGAKLVVFGGISTALFSTLGSIYVLDVLSLSWKKGTNIDPSQNRTGNNNKHTPIQPLVIYNLKTNIWTNQFSIPAPPPTSTTVTSLARPGATATETPGSTDTSVLPSASGPTTGATSQIIIGLVGGGITVTFALFLLGFVLYLRRRQGHRHHRTVPSPDPTLKHQYHPRDTNSDEDEELSTYPPSHPYGHAHRADTASPTLKRTESPYSESNRVPFSPFLRNPPLDYEGSDHWSSSSQTAIASPSLAPYYPPPPPSTARLPEPSERSISRAATPSPRLPDLSSHQGAKPTEGYPSKHPYGSDPQVGHDTSHDSSIKVLRPMAASSPSLKSDSPRVPKGILKSSSSREHVQRSPQYHPTKLPAVPGPLSMSMSQDRRLNHPQYRSAELSSRPPQQQQQQQR
ncbi:unnamed protein product [Mortierella alpina]